MISIQKRLAAIGVFTLLGLFAAVAITEPSGPIDPDKDLPIRTRFEDLLAGHHAEANPLGVTAPNDEHTTHQETP